MAKILTPPARTRHGDRARAAAPRHGARSSSIPRKPEFYDKAADAEYYLGSPRTGIGNEFFRSAPKLKLVQLTSAGYDRVDIEAARKAGVAVSNNGGANSVAVSEHAVMLMLAVYKQARVPPQQRRRRQVAHHRLRRQPHLYELEGKRLGIVGLGNIGKKVARRVRGFDMDVRYFDVAPARPRTRRTPSASASRCSPSCSAPRTSSTCTCRSTTRTRKMISTRELGMMKRDRDPGQHMPRPGGGRGRAPRRAHRGDDRGGRAST